LLAHKTFEDTARPGFEDVEIVSITGKLLGNAGATIQQTFDSFY
jgi:hypothetical protein